LRSSGGSAEAAKQDRVTGNGGNGHTGLKTQRDESRRANLLGFDRTSRMVPYRRSSRCDSTGGLQWNCGICSALAWGCNSGRWIPHPSRRLVRPNARSGWGAWIENYFERSDELFLDRIWGNHRHARIVAVHTLQIERGSNWPVRMVLVIRRVGLGILMLS